MKKILSKLIILVFVLVTIFSVSGCGTITLKNVEGKAKNVILMIGDGMGPQQIRAGELYRDEELTMQGFPYKTTVETYSRTAAVTDSAAAATAMATGTRTVNGYIGRDILLSDLETIIDVASSEGKRTGVITTDNLYGATPMGFSAHSNSRNNREELLQSAATTSNVNLFASYTLDASYEKYFTDAGYQVPGSIEGISEQTADKVIGSYNITGTAKSMSAGAEIAFDKLVTEALEYLSKDEDGFFLMAEGAHIDHGGHNNDFGYMLEELLAFDDAVKAVLKWAEKRDDTVVIVTADHETGGLTLSKDVTHKKIVKAYKNDYGDCYRWDTSGHTKTFVNCYINGANINFAQYELGLNERIQNTDIFLILKSLMLG